SPGQKMPTDPAPAAAGHAVDLSVRCEGPEQAVLLVIRAGSEIHRIGLATIPAVADAEAPQPVDDDRLSAGIAQLVDELSGRSIVGVDMTVAEISDQQRACEWSEAGRRHGHAPGRIELAVLNQALQRLTRDIEGVDDSVTHSRDVVMLIRILHRECYDK